MREKPSRYRYVPSILTWAGLGVLIYVSTPWVIVLTLFVLGALAFRGQRALILLFAALVARDGAEHKGDIVLAYIWPSALVRPAFANDWTQWEPGIYTAAVLLLFGALAEPAIKDWFKFLISVYIMPWVVSCITRYRA
jgi:hypothetical protein